MTPAPLSTTPAVDVPGLVARSRRIGADPALVVHGGGNTSSKGFEADWRGRLRPVLRVKGSGTDLATIAAGGFPGLYLDELDALRAREAMSDEEMVAYLAHCMREPGGRAPSIETLLHAWVAAPHVDHTHADAICALSNHPDGRAAIAEALGPEIAVVPYLRPGFELSRRVAELAGDAEAIVLDHHGLVTWGETHDASTDLTVSLDARARAYLDERRPTSTVAAVPDLGAADVRALLGALRIALAVDGVPAVLLVDRRQRALADRPDVALVATAARSTPDHILRIGARSAVVESAADVAKAIAAFAAEGTARFARQAARLPEGTAMLSTLPRLVLVPGLGCVAAGADLRTAQVVADLGLRSHGVTATVLDVFGAVAWLDEPEIVDFDYWPLELRKLAAVPAPPPLAGQVMVVDAGAHSGAIAGDLEARGALVAASVSVALDAWGAVDVVVAGAERLAAHRAAGAGAATTVALSDFPQEGTPADHVVEIAATAADTSVATAVGALLELGARTSGATRGVLQLV